MSTVCCGTHSSVCDISCNVFFRTTSIGAMNHFLDYGIISIASKWNDNFLTLTRIYRNTSKHPAKSGLQDIGNLKFNAYNWKQHTLNIPCQVNYLYLPHDTKYMTYLRKVSQPFCLYLLLLLLHELRQLVKLHFILFSMVRIKNESTKCCTCIILGKYVTVLRAFRNITNGF